MSNKDRHQELLKRLDTLDDKLDQLLIATNQLVKAMNITVGVLDPPDNRDFQQREKDLHRQFQQQAGRLYPDPLVKPTAAE